MTVRDSSVARQILVARRGAFVLPALMLLATLLMLPLPPQDPAPGIDRELARDRAARVRDVEYDLRFRIGENAREVSGSVVLRFTLAADVDPTYAAGFAAARARGVEAIAWGTRVTPEGIEVEREVAIGV